MPPAVQARALRIGHLLPRLLYASAGAAIAAAVVAVRGSSAVEVPPYTPFVTEVAAANNPAWSPDAVRHILADAPFLASAFSIGWTPDSRRLVMAGSPLHGGTSRLLMVDTAAGSLRPLTGGRESETAPTVSSEGSRIAFVSQHSGRDLIQFPIDGGAPEPSIVTSRSESYPDMSASGLLAHITDADGSPAVRLRSTADTWSRKISGAGEFAEGGPPSEVRLSPDGQRAAVGTYGAEHLL